MEVSIRELKNQLSRYLRRVAEGKEVVITSHKRPVARLVPPLPVSVAEDTAGAIELLKTLPWVRMGKGGKLKGAKHPIKLKSGDKSASDMVLEDRR